MCKLTKEDVVGARCDIDIVASSLAKEFHPIFIFRCCSSHTEHGRHICSSSRGFALRPTCLPLPSSVPSARWETSSATPVQPSCANSSTNWHYAPTCYMLTLIAWKSKSTPPNFSVRSPGRALRPPTRTRTRSQARLAPRRQCL